MGNTFSGELPGSWKEPDVKEWMERAKMNQQCTYLQFEGCQFHDITDLSVKLRITKICYAIYGAPTEEAENLEEAYSSEQREFGAKIYDKIRETWMEAPLQKFKLGFIFIFCKEDKKEYQVPLFRLQWDNSESRYIDTGCRVYNSADDWKKNNQLPMMKYCHPADLFYTCNSGKYEFDSDQEVVLDFQTSPACDLSARLARVADVVISAVGISVGVAAMFTPVGIISGGVLLTVGGTSATWGFGRAAQRLIDKATHGESLTDLEGALLIFSIIAAPLNLLNGFVTAKLAAGAASGRIFSQSQRILATILSLTVLTMDSFSMIMNVSNLVNKLMDDNLTTLDVLQFSVSTLFFANTLIQPKTAWGVIENAQKLRINAVADTMTDEQAKMAFKKYLDQNKGNGGIKDTSKIVRNLNKIEDPNFFFKSVKDFDSVKIGGRKGNTVILNGGDGTSQRVNPNNRTNYHSVKQNGAPKIANQAKLRKCLGKDYEDHKHLGNLTDQQKGRMNKVFGGAARYDPEVVDYASRLADRMNVKNDPDGFMSLVEVVAKGAKGSFINLLKDTLSEIFKL